MKRIDTLLCALLFFALSVMGNAQTLSLPKSVRDWMKSPGLEHATVTLEVRKGPRVLYSLDPERMVIPASVMKLVTAATAWRTLGQDYVWPDSVGLVDETAPVHLPGLEHYNPDWLVEDVGEYVEPLENLLPDSGQVLSRVVKRTLNESLNLQAETMLHLLTPSCRLDSGLQVVQRYWAEQGLDMTSLKMYDGNGVSPSDRVTAHFICSLLAEMQTDQAFRQTLPLIGKEGTLRRFLKGSRLEGWGRMKSGSLKSVVSYAGYITGSDGRTYIVSIFVNNFTKPNKEVRKDIEKVLLSLIP